MKNKIYFNLLSLVPLSALLLASCTEMYDKVQYSSNSLDNELKITAMIGDEVGTRSGGSFTSDTLTLDNIPSFYMKAFYGGMMLIDTSTVSGTYTRGRFTKSKDSNVWKDGNTLPYYWPEEQVKFLAFSCREDKLPGASFEITQDHIKWTDFQVEDASSSNYKTQHDYAAAVTTQKGSDGFTVSLRFQHLLSRVSINIWAPANKFTHTKRLDVVSFKFDSVGVKGTFNYEGASTDSSFKASTWGSVTQGTVGAVDDVWNLLDSIPKASSLQGTGKLSGKTPWLNVIPGTNVSDSLTVHIKLTPKTGSEYYKSVGLKIPVGSVRQKDSGSSDDTYHPGYQYVYNLKVTGQDDEEGKLDSLKIALESVTVAPWNNDYHETDHTGEVGDNTLQAIFKSAEAFAQINVRNNVTIYGTSVKKDTVVVYKEAVLNLNGYTLTLDAGATKPAFTIENNAKLIIDNDTTSTSTHGHFGFIKNNSTTAALFNIVAASSPDEPGKIIIRGGTFDFDPTSPTCYIEGVSTDTAFPKTYKADYFTDAYGNKKYRETKVTESVVNGDSVYLVEQTIKDYQE